MGREGAHGTPVDQFAKELVLISVYMAQGPGPGASPPPPAHPSRHSLAILGPATLCVGNPQNTLERSYGCRDAFGGDGDTLL